jgi:DNA-binding MarR family transcriptional regulator
MPYIVKRKYVRSKLNTGQIAILEQLYKYRFASRMLLADSLGLKAGSSLHEKLEVLNKRGYIDKRFDKRLKLQGVPVAYYLTPDGWRVLQKLPKYDFIDQSFIKTTYSDKRVGIDFVADTLNVHQHTKLLQKQYPGLKVFTKRELGRYSYFPELAPDALLSLPSNDPNQPHRFFFDIIPDRTPRTALFRRIKSYCDFFEGGWDDTDSEIPVILLVSEWGPAERSLQRQVARILRTEASDLQAYTTTTTAIEKVVDNKAIWTPVDDTDELISLDAM